MKLNFWRRTHAHVRFKDGSEILTRALAPTPTITPSTSTSDDPVIAEPVLDSSSNLQCSEDCVENTQTGMKEKAPETTSDDTPLLRRSTREKKGLLSVWAIWYL